MDFFGLQEDARRQSRRLVLLFALAVLAVVACVYLAVIGPLLVFDESMQGFWHPQLFATTSAITLIIVASGSLYQIVRLRRGGGAAVAEMLGGVAVPHESDDLLLRRLVNVVEEMAIAAGLPVPAVYRIPEPGINAFAAGFSPSDAVVAVTDGAIELLKRDELQGVVAHEFAHILNGDMRLKMRLMGWLFGITLVSDIGIMLMRASADATPRVDRRSGGGILALAVLGFLVFVVGTVGLVLADLIKRAVSRQREYLADAGAVQFTRNPMGLANALKVIGGYRTGSRIRHPAAQRASHFFFCEALKGTGRKDWWATHPPLIERIRRLDPSFSGAPEPVDVRAQAEAVRAEAAASFAEAGTMPRRSVAHDTDAVMAEIAQPEASELHEARARMDALDEVLRARLRDPLGAQALALALLLSGEKEVRRGQMRALEREVAPPVFREVLDLADRARRLPAECRLPAVERAMPGLRAMSAEQYRAFARAVRALIKADGRIGPFEYMLHRMMLRHLAPVFGVRRRVARGRARPADLMMVWAMLAHYGAHPDRTRVLGEAAGEAGVKAEVPERIGFRQLDEALDRLEHADPGLKRRLMRGAVRIVLADGRVVPEEMELLRAVADAVDVPVPPLRIE